MTKGKKFKKKLIEDMDEIFFSDIYGLKAIIDQQPKFNLNKVNSKEVLAHGYPSADSRTNDLLPKSLLEDPILYPAKNLLSALEFGAAVTLTDPNRAELMARFKSA